MPLKLSIIIPAYNAEDYIEFCLNSCLNQDLDSSEYEIIVINDGSTDNTAKKILPFTKIHSNIILKTQENKGFGAARNLGVIHSKGDYIYFLDADDYIASNTLGTLIKLLVEHKLDMIGFNCKWVFDNQFVNSKHTNTDVKINNIYKGIDYLATYKYSPEVCYYINKKTFYLESELNFFDKKFVQDSYFTPTLISKAERIAYVDYDVYRYRQSNNSITRKKSSEHIKRHLEDMRFAVVKLYELKNELKSVKNSNKKAIQRLEVKQQHYVFIIISRFIKSNLNKTLLKNILSDFKNIDAFPLNKFMSTSDYQNKIYRILTFIYNRNYLLYPSLNAYRLIRRIKI